MAKFEITINDPDKAWKISKETSRLYMEGLTKEKALKEAVRQYQSSSKANNK